MNLRVTKNSKKRGNKQNLHYKNQLSSCTKNIYIYIYISTYPTCQTLVHVSSPIWPSARTSTFYLRHQLMWLGTLLRPRRLSQYWNEMRGWIGVCAIRTWQLTGLTDYFNGGTTFKFWMEILLYILNNTHLFFVFDYL